MISTHSRNFVFICFLILGGFVSAQVPELAFRGGQAGGNAHKQTTQQICSVQEGYQLFAGGRGGGVSNNRLIQSNCQSMVAFSPFNGGISTQAFHKKDIRSECLPVSLFSVFSGGLSGGFDFRKRIFRNCDGPNSMIELISPLEVCEGDTLIIEGAYLSRVDQVTFRNQINTNDFIVINSSKIAVRVPVGAISGAVEVSGPDGTDLSNMEVMISPLLHAAFLFEQNSGLHFTFTSTADHVSAYFWDFGNGITSDLQNPEVTFETGGQYLITLVVSNACGNDTATQSIEFSTLFLEKSENIRIQIRPNPFQENFQLVLLAIGEGRLYIYDLLGHVVRTESFQANGKTEFTYNMASYPAGTYFIRIEVSGQVFSGKLIKL